MDLQLDAVWVLATKRHPATQLDLYEQRSEEYPRGHNGLQTIPHGQDKSLARPTVELIHTIGWTFVGKGLSSHPNIFR